MGNIKSDEIPADNDPFPEKPKSRQAEWLPLINQDQTSVGSNLSTNWYNESAKI